MTSGCLFGRSARDNPPDRLGPDAALQLTARADEAFDKGDYQEAVELYRRSLSVLRDQPGALNNLGNALAAKGSLLDADEVYRRAVELDPSRPEPLVNRGILHINARWPKQALTYFDQALSLDQRWLPALRGKARAAHEVGLVNETYLAQLRTALFIENDPTWRPFFDEEHTRVRLALSLDDAQP
jgi:tetratricopeptide (TPR) repeat protein